MKRTRTRIPNGTKPSAAGLSAVCVCNAHAVRRKRGGAGQMLMKPVMLSLCGAPPQGLCKASRDSGVCWKQFMILLEEVLVCGGVFIPPALHVPGRRRDSHKNRKATLLVRNRGSKCMVVQYCDTGGWECLVRQIRAHPTLLLKLESRQRREGLLGRTSTSGSSVPGLPGAGAN